jgi:hypothetical protein
MPRNNSVWPRCGDSVAFAGLIRFPDRRMGPATPGRHVHRAKHEAGIRNQAAGQELKPAVGVPARNIEISAKIPLKFLGQCQRTDWIGLC